jgi:hypothetical protein
LANLLSVMKKIYVSENEMDKVTLYLFTALSLTDDSSLRRPSDRLAGDGRVGAAPAPYTYIT